MITKENSKVDANGIYIPFEVLTEMQKHYNDVKTHCEHTNSDRLARYYEGKTDLLNEVVALVKEERKNAKVAKTTVV